MCYLLVTCVTLTPCRRRSSPRVNKRSVGKAARREAASLLLNCRPARVEAAARLRVSHAAGMLNRSGRKTHSDRLGEDEAQKALHPQSPAGEAINFSRQTGVQREKRSTPAARTVSSGRSDQLQPPDWCPAGEGLITPTAGRGPRTKGLSLRPSARAACEGLNHSALAAVPLGRPFRCNPGLRERPPGF